MKRRTTLVAATVLIVVLIASLLTANFLLQKPSEVKVDFYVGVDVGYGDESDVYKVADAVQGYCNLIIIGSLAVTSDTPKLTRVCDYLYQRGFSFIVYVGYGPVVPEGPERQFFNSTVNQWGNKFLGAYIFDEPGGKQLDYLPGSGQHQDKLVPQAENFTDAAAKYIEAVFVPLFNFTGPSFYDAPELRVFTSDYALYWFDYLAGYNVVLGEFVANNSRQLTIALSRGAGHAQHMDWGTMITWKYREAPFLEEPEQLYDDMVLAYDNGAKYIVVFNSPENQTATSEIGTLTPQHLEAMRLFWNHAIENPRLSEVNAETAFVLPSDYGYGFRGPNDTIWGLTWPTSASATAVEAKIWSDTNTLISQYDQNIDFVYETYTNSFPVRLMYKQLIFWNGTVIGSLNG